MNIENKQITKKIIEVKIGNIKYNLSTTENEDYIKGIAKYVNNKITEFSQLYTNINKNSTSFFLIIALNIANDLFKQRQQFTMSSKQLEDFKKTLETKEKDNLSIDKLKIILEEKDKEINKLKTENKNILKQKNDEISAIEEESLNLLYERENEIAGLKKEIEKLSSQLKTNIEFD